MDIDVAARAIADGHADLAGFGRRLIADPGYAGKATSGRDDDIVPCIACKECIHYSLLLNQPLQCTVNPACGHEREYQLVTAAKPRKVMVVGGGPAGMEAAIIAARRGHQVTLYEQSSQLGGQLLLAAIPPHKEEIANLIRYLVNQVKKAGVRVELGQAVTRDTVDKAKPEVVVLATGMESITPEIPGLDEMNVVAAADVLRGTVQAGIEVVIVGGELVGCETAEFLADRGKLVTVVEILDRLATKVNPLTVRRLFDRLMRKGVTLLAGVTNEVFHDQTLSLVTKEGENRVIGADTVVIAAGARSNTTLQREIKGMVPEIHSIDDCVEPRNIAEAISEGFKVGATV